MAGGTNGEWLRVCAARLESDTQKALEGGAQASPPGTHHWLVFNLACAWDFPVVLCSQRQVRRAEGGVAAAPLLCALWPSYQAAGW